jgi:ferric-dicitrate binding protein FerR (iron transport regulator)
MGLSEREQQALEKIERKLADGDPMLAARLAVLQPPPMPPPPRERRGTRILILVALIGAVVLMLLAVIVTDVGRQQGWPHPAASGTVAASVTGA